MTIFDGIFLNAAHMLVPFAIYLFYIAYKNTIDDRENELAITITIFSALYIILKYNIQIFHDIPMIIINIPLVISYLKKNNISIAISSIVALSYYYKFYDDFLIILVLEYGLYYLIYLFCNKRLNINYFITIFTVLKMIFMMIITAFIYDFHTLIYHYMEILFLGIIFGLMVVGIIFLLKQAEAVLKIHMSAKEIEHDKQIKTTLFQITHEIKNPIAVCKGYLDMFDIDNPEHAKKYVPVIKEEIDKTLVLLEDFLSMNKIKINKDILDINLLLSEVLENYELIMKEHKVRTNFHISDDEIYIYGDYNRLVQVFVNIIKNSIEALGNNPAIEVWTKLKNNQIHIYFKDNGHGIPREILDKIKEPFFTTKAKGTGLGVPLSTGIIEAHDGKINYESKEGVYTLVTVSLPVEEILTI